MELEGENANANALGIWVDEWKKIEVCIVVNNQ